MKKLIRNSLISVIYLTGLVWVYQKWKRRNGPLVRVLCFHDVLDREWFSNLLKELTKRYHVITPEEFHAQQFDSSKINVLLTFDDGYQSWVDIVLPVLQQCNVKAIFFITSGLLDAADAGEADRFVRDQLKLTTRRSVLTWGGARKLVTAGHTIGGHTRNHQSLSDLSSEQQTQEIEEDKKILEENLDCAISDFAFPFGTYTDCWISNSIRTQSSYQNWYSAISSFAKSDEELIHRTMLESDSSLRQVHEWIRGGYDLLSTF